MRDITTQPAAEAVVTSIIDLARNLGLTCIAEGVETAEQLEYLEQKNCAEIQGFLYSPALPASDCGDLIRLGRPGFLAVSGLVTNAFYDRAKRALDDHFRVI